MTAYLRYLRNRLWCMRRLHPPILDAPIVDYRDGQPLRLYLCSIHDKDLIR